MSLPRPLGQGLHVPFHILRDGTCGDIFLPLVNGIIENVTFAKIWVQPSVVVLL
jgi:hypothetical protein